jgi:hypothetical protein
MARSGRPLSAVRRVPPSMPNRQDHEKDVEAEACARTWGREEGLQRGMFVG